MNILWISPVTISRTEKSWFIYSLFIFPSHKIKHVFIRLYAQLVLGPCSEQQTLAKPLVQEVPEHNQGQIARKGRRGKNQDLNCNEILKQLACSNCCQCSLKSFHTSLSELESQTCGHLNTFFNRESTTLNHQITWEGDKVWMDTRKSVINSKNRNGEIHIKCFLLLFMNHFLLRRKQIKTRKKWDKHSGARTAERPTFTHSITIVNILCSPVQQEVLRITQVWNKSQSKYLQPWKK